MLNIDEFLNYLKYELNRSPRTVDSYAEDLHNFESFLQGLNSSFTWENIDADVIRNWMEEMVDKGNRSTTVNRRLSALRSFYRFALMRQQVRIDPTRTIRGPKKNRLLPQFLKEDEMDRFLDEDVTDGNYEEVRMRTIIAMFYETGMRLSELVGLDDCSVNFLTGELKVTGKRDKQRIIPFGDDLKKRILAYMEVRNEKVVKTSPALFLTTTGKRMKPDSVRNVVKSGLTRFCSLKKKSPHVLRHTFATIMLNHGAGIESLKKLLGHASLSTTEIYAHTTFEQLKQVYIEAHPRA